MSEENLKKIGMYSGKEFLPVIHIENISNELFVSIGGIHKINNYEFTGIRYLTLKIDCKKERNEFYILKDKIYRIINPTITNTAIRIHDIKFSAKMFIFLFIKDKLYNV